MGEAKRVAVIMPNEDGHKVQSTPQVAAVEALATVKLDESILAEAERLVGGDRLKFYGPPNENFARIAEMWSAYLKTEVTPLDVCALMILLKVARIKTGGSYHRDSAVDAAGYARLMEILAEKS